MGAGHVTDANSIALWKWLSGPPWVSSVNPQAWNQLTESGVDTLAVPGVISKARGCVANTSQKLQGPTGQASLSATFQGEWTVEAWVARFGAQPTADTGIILNFSGLGLAQTDNTQLSVQVGGAGPNAGKLLGFWRYNSAVNVATYSTSTLSIGVWQHVAVVKKSAGGGLYDCLLYINGVAAGSGLGLPNANGGSSGVMRIATLGDSNFADVAMNGAVDEIHVSNVARSASFILNNYNRGIAAPAPVVASHSGPPAVL